MGVSNRLVANDLQGCRPNSVHKVEAGRVVRTVSPRCSGGNERRTAEVCGSGSGKLGSKRGVFAWICRPRSVWRFRIKKKAVKDGLRNSRFNYLGSIKNTFNGSGATKSRVGWIRFVSKRREQQIS